MAAMPRPLAGLAAAFAVSGVLHLVRPAGFVAIVPRFLPAKYALVYASGVAELTCAVGLAIPGTRRYAGLASAGLLVAVFPANVQMAVDVSAHRGSMARAAAMVRLPLQWPMIQIAWRAWRSQLSR